MVPFQYVQANDDKPYEAFHVLLDCHRTLRSKPRPGDADVHSEVQRQLFETLYVAICAEVSRDVGEMNYSTTVSNSL
jgi:hypothetical protein